uniref:Uncharacterized protein n=1 Tax=Glossina austeni TaxID=7395 RepID=A0A1A9V3Y6_GLOAU
MGNNDEEGKTEFNFKVNVVLKAKGYTDDVFIYYVHLFTLYAIHTHTEKRQGTSHICTLMGRKEECANIIAQIRLRVEFPGIRFTLIASEPANTFTSYGESEAEEFKMKSDNRIDSLNSRCPLFAGNFVPLLLALLLFQSKLLLLRRSVCLLENCLAFLLAAFIHTQSMIAGKHYGSIMVKVRACVATCTNATIGVSLKIERRQRSVNDFEKLKSKF